MAVLDDALALRDSIGTAIKADATVQGEVSPGGFGWAQLESIRTRLGLAFTEANEVIDALGGLV